MGGELPITPTMHPNCLLKLAHDYKHLGTRVAPHALMGPEIATRCGIIRSESRKVVGKLGKLEGEVRHKMAMLQAHVMSKGFFHAGAWGAISGALQAKLHSATMVPLRRLADLHGIGYYDDRDLCNRMGLAPPLLAVRALRLPCSSDSSARAIAMCSRCWWPPSVRRDRV